MPYRTPCRTGCTDDNGVVVSFSKAPYEEEHYNMTHADLGQQFVYSCLLVKKCDCLDVFLHWNAFYFHVKKFHPELLDTVKGKSRLDQENHRKLFRWTIDHGNEAASELWVRLMSGARNARRPPPVALVSTPKMSDKELGELAESLEKRVAKMEKEREEIIELEKSIVRRM